MDFKRSIQRFLAGVLILAFLVSDVRVYAQGVMQLPAPGTCLELSPVFAPPLLKGIKVYRNDPFRFDFILDKGDDKTADDQVKTDSNRLIKYFLASLTVPEKDLWVNLSPYEKVRIVPEAFGQTEMGRDLLAQDYILKQVTASLIYPEGDVGKQFWAKVYAAAQAKFGTTDIPVDTFNKVWITPEKATVYENKDAAFVVESRLKVMLESDYLAQEKNVSELSPSPLWGGSGRGEDVAKNILREVVIPILEKEVNEGKNFTPLRQVYHSLILATWYKRKVKAALLSPSPLWGGNGRGALGQYYADQNKISGVNIADPKESEKIWAQYVEAFKKGAYNLIKEEVDPKTQTVVPRKYFSGGMDCSMLGKLVMSVTHDPAMLSKVTAAGLMMVSMVAADISLGASDSPKNMIDQKTGVAITWTLPSDGKNVQGKDVLLKGIRHPVASSRDTLMSVLRSTSDQDREEAVTRLLASEHYAGAIKSSRTTVEDIRSLVSSGQLGILAAEEYGSRYPRSQLPIIREEYRFVYEKYLHSIKDPKVVDDVCLFIFGPTNFLLMKEEIPENVQFGNVDNKYLGAKWLLAHAVFVAGVQDMGRKATASLNSFVGFARAMITDQRFVREDHQKMIELASGLSGRDRVSAERIVFLHQQLVEMNDQRNAWMAQQIKGMLAGIPSGKKVYAIVGYKHVDEVVESLNSGVPLLTNVIKGSDVMVKVEEKLADFIAGVVRKNYQGVWSIRKEQDLLVFSNQSWEMVFEFSRSETAMSINVKGQGLVDSILKACDALDQIRVFEVPGSDGYRKIIVSIAADIFRKAMREDFSRELSAVGLSGKSDRAENSSVTSEENSMRDNDLKPWMKNFTENDVNKELIESYFLRIKQGDEKVFNELRESYLDEEWAVAAFVLRKCLMELSQDEGRMIYLSVETLERIKDYGNRVAIDGIPRKKWMMFVYVEALRQRNVESVQTHIINEVISSAVLRSPEVVTDDVVSALEFVLNNGSQWPKRYAFEALCDIYSFSGTDKSVKDHAKKLLISAELDAFKSQYPKNEEALVVFKDRVASEPILAMRLENIPGGFMASENLQYYSPVEDAPLIQDNGRSVPAREVAFKDSYPDVPEEQGMGMMTRFGQGSGVIADAVIPSGSGGFTNCHAIIIRNKSNKKYVAFHVWQGLDALIGRYRASDLLDYLGDGEKEAIYIGSTNVHWPLTLAKESEQYLQSKGVKTHRIIKVSQPDGQAWSFVVRPSTDQLLIAWTGKNKKAYWVNAFENKRAPDQVEDVKNGVVDEKLSKADSAEDSSIVFGGKFENDQARALRGIDMAVGKESATARDFLGHLEMIRKGSKSEVKVLGLSSGAAEDELFLARQGYQVLATDVAVEKMDKVISAATSEGVRMKGYKVDVTQKLPFADGEFDAVYWRLGAHYMTNQQLRDFAYELNRVMRSGGILYVVANSKDDPNYVQFGGRGNADGMVTFQDSFADRKLSRNFFNEQDLNDLFSPFFKSYSITKHKEQLKHTSNFLIFAATKGDKVGGGVDKSQRSHLGKNTGGIDLNPSKIDMTTKSQGEGVEFNLDPAILKRMQDASGVTPVIIGIHPLDNLYQFFEIPPPIPSPQGGGR